MSNETTTVLTEAQRKYIKQRLDGVYQQKRAQLTAATKPQALSTEDVEARRMRIQDELDRVGLDWKVNKYAAGDILLPEDVAAENARKVAEVAVKDKLNQLLALYNELMDEVMLGTDANAITTVLKRLQDFN